MSSVIVLNPAAMAASSGPGASCFGASFLAGAAFGFAVLFPLPELAAATFGAGAGSRPVLIIFFPDLSWPSSPYDPEWTISSGSPRPMPVLTGAFAAVLFLPGYP